MTGKTFTRQNSTVLQIIAGVNDYSPSLVET